MASAVCPTCKRVQRSLHSTRDALHALRDVDVPDPPISGDVPRNQS